MPLWPAVVVLVFGLVVLTAGCWSEYDQSRQTGPIALIPTLHYAVAAAMCSGFAYLALTHQTWVRWWHSPIAFLVAGVAGARLIAAARNCAEAYRKQQQRPPPGGAANR